MRYTSWAAWEWDSVTAGWALWVLWFVLLESYSLKFERGQELTAHLRPLFLSFPVLWWAFFGLWLWIGVHLLAPALELALLDRVSRS